MEIVMSRHLACKHCGSIRIAERTSKYRGVDYIKGKQLYRARSTIKGNTHNIGWFKTERAALVEYEMFVLQHGLSKRSNFYAGETK
jgi:hypothetical protein